MGKFVVHAVHRPGYDGAWRAGRKWPSSGSVEVEVVEQAEDPPVDPTKGIIIGTATLEALLNDGHISIRPAGDPQTLARSANAVEALKAEVVRLTAENVALKADVERLQGPVPKSSIEAPKVETKSHEVEPRHTKAKKGE
jgi:hypothetical protein